MRPHNRRALQKVVGQRLPHALLQQQPSQRAAEDGLTSGRHPGAVRQSRPVGRRPLRQSFGRRHVGEAEQEAGDEELERKQPVVDMNPLAPLPPVNLISLWSFGRR